ncbi:hypothetical protein [Micrococcus lylae]|uniref:hypothetical protein n=1 Tax=Micrococcus lylae TaxID=1273 RepID=UPI000C80A300|nr:hypothetical protein [Micrococcus lylae]WIK82161.1 hypothetical protein CJ228_011335 [Micrococcus lylae]
MTKHLTANVAVTGPRGPVVLLAGTVPPEWAEDQIGEHLTAETDQKPAPATSKRPASKTKSKPAAEEQDTEDAQDDEAAEDQDTEDAEAPDFTGPAPRTRRSGKKS